jgi:hypothetical protein
MVFGARQAKPGSEARSGTVKILWPISTSKVLLTDVHSAIAVLSIAEN